MKHRTQLLLDERHYKYLQREAAARRCSLSGALRNLIEEKMASSSVEVAPENDPVFQIAGKYRSGHSDTSRKAEDILYGDKNEG